MSKTKGDKYESKKQLLIERTALALAVSEEEAVTLLSIPRKQSVRVNTLKYSTDEFDKLTKGTSAVTEHISWIDDGYYIEEGLSTIRDTEAASSGQLYIQNAASWLPVIALSPKPGETILDMCAAPGGKTSHIAQITGNAAMITANDNSRPRLHRLQGNLSRLGVENVEFLLHDATRLAHKLGAEQFDKILLDAPCSGEGMMTLDSRKDFESWSVAHVKRLQQLQKRLIVQAWQLLKPGGTLVYSTCTMAPEENEAVLDYLLRHNDDIKVQSLDMYKNELSNAVAPVAAWNDKTYDSRIKDALRLKPSPNVEAFFVAKLTKTA